MREFKVEAKIQVYKQIELLEEEKTLINYAKEVALNAYAPYSGFQVGAAALLSDGRIVTGNNQENGAYPSGLCAERTCLFHAHALHPQQIIRTLVIVAYSQGRFTRNYIPPCGACRQVMKEYEDLQHSPIRILMVGEEEVYAASSVADLLPLSFVLS